METISKANRLNSVRAQVARSRGNEWMISSYNAWQQRSPLGTVPKNNNSSLMRVVSRLTSGEIQASSAISFSMKALTLALGFILSGRIR